MGRIVYECCMREEYGSQGWAAWESVASDMREKFDRIGAAIQHETGKRCMERAAGQ